MPPIEPDSPCTCGHVYDEHGAWGCTVILGEPGQECPCFIFELDVEAIS